MIEHMRHRLGTEVDPPRTRDLWQATEVFLGLRYDAAVAAALLSGVADMQESTAYRRILLTGEALGEARGDAEDKAEGEQEILTREAVFKWGPPLPGVFARLQAVTDLAELGRLGERLMTAASWDDWLGRA